MNSSAEMQTKLRRLIDEPIPAGKTDAQTRFANDEIVALLTDNATIEAAAAEGWELKASRVFSDRGGMVSATAGAETTKWVDPDKFASFCSQRAEFYRSKAPGKVTGSRVFEINYPNPPGVSD